ncbi:MAG: 4'-phosphopantetheinyl transferase superfamily protein [Candidatus Hydrogenedentes bacterium]|nr:4'-phosphopantetheinyl transferase superfamily protein [Candidatus Hydrogenedentota bacterium]
MDVWRIPLPSGAKSSPNTIEILSTEERARAQRLRDPQKSAQFAATRRALRHILARYVAMPPESLIIEVSLQGKPFLMEKDRASTLHFNVSHTAGLALCAVARDRTVGIDVEEVDVHREILLIARRFFHPGEFAALESLPQSERTPAFYRCWCAKEALVKASGEGLHLPLNSFRLDCDPGRPLALLEAGTKLAGNPWSLRELALGPAYAGVCATSIPAPTWRHWNYTAET